METTQVKKASGRVAAVSQKPDFYGFKVGNGWYGGHGSCPVQKGDEVEVQYVENGRFNDVEDIRILAAHEEELSSAGAGNGHEARISRAVALKCAAMLFAGTEKSDVVLRTAQGFEEWLNATSPGTG